MSTFEPQSLIACEERHAQPNQQWKLIPVTSSISTQSTASTSPSGGPSVAAFGEEIGIKLT